MSECDCEAAGQLLILHEDKFHRFSNFTRVHFCFLFLFFLLEVIKYHRLRSVNLQLDYNLENEASMDFVQIAEQ